MEEPLYAVYSILMTMAKDGHQRVANKKDLQEGSLLKVEPQGKPIVLSMVDGKVHAMDAVCSHEGGPLEEGTLEGYNLTCPWIMLFSMCEMQKFQIRLFGLQI